MSDNLENFVRNNSEKFSPKQPRPELWDKIQTGLAQNAAAGATGAATAAKAGSGLAKFASAWKLAALGVTLAVAGVVTYVVINSNDGAGTNASNAGVNPTPTNQVEPDLALQPLVQPPVKGVDVPYHTFSVDARKGGELSLPNGTLLQIPADAFTDASGKQAEGSVEIRYREFHDAADIILSGIPMVYNHKGKNEDFETAGMIEVLGFQNDAPVKVAQGKEIKFEMASFTEEDDYNFYYLNPEKREWVDMNNPAKLGKNKRKKAGITLINDSSSVAVVKPRKPVNPKNATVDGEIGFQVDYALFPELKPFKKIRWVAADPSFLKSNQWIFTKVWNKISLEEVPGDQMSYNMVLSNKSKKFVLPALPILDGEEYEKAMADFKSKMAKYDRIQSQRNAESGRLEVQANVTRSFSVAGFGIFNCDRFASFPDAVSVMGTFDFGDEYMDGRKTLIYHILSNRSVKALDKFAQRQIVTFAPSADQQLLAILPDGSLAVFSAEDFRSIPEGAKEYEFKLKRTGRVVKSAFDIREVLGA